MPTTATPVVLTDAGYLFIAPLASTVPTNTVTAGKFADAWPAAWLSLGATEDGSQFSYSTSVEPIRVAEFYDPIKYATTERGGNIAFNLASWTLTNFRRAVNGGIAAVTTTGTTGQELASISPPAVGAEVRAMIGWESLDATLRLICYQTIQGGEVSSAFKKAPDYATIPCTYNLEIPASGTPWTMFSAGLTRV